MLFHAISTHKIGFLDFFVEIDASYGTIFDGNRDQIKVTLNGAGNYAVPNWDKIKKG